MFSHRSLPCPTQTKLLPRPSRPSYSVTFEAWPSGASGTTQMMIPNPITAKTKLTASKTTQSVQNTMPSSRSAFDESSDAITRATPHSGGGAWRTRAAFSMFFVVLRWELIDWRQGWGLGGRKGSRSSSSAARDQHTPPLPSALMGLDCFFGVSFKIHSIPQCHHWKYKALELALYSDYVLIKVS